MFAPAWVALARANAAAGSCLIPGCACRIGSGGGRRAPRPRHPMETIGEITVDIGERARGTMVGLQTNYCALLRGFEGRSCLSLSITYPQRTAPRTSGHGTSENPARSSSSGRWQAWEEL